MKIQWGREKEPCRNGHICTSWSVPWASAGERETLNRLNMRWSWHLTDLDLGNPEWWNAWNGCKVMQEMRMQWSVGDHSPWRRMSQFTFVSAMVSAFVSPRNFIWWNPDSHGYGIHRRSFCEAMELWGWSLLSELSAFICKRHTDLPSPPFVWGYRKKCVTRKDPAWPRCGNPFPLFLSLWYFVITTQKD